MIDPRPEPDHAAVERWLSAQHQMLVTNLAGALDLETGLHEVTISAHHRDLISGLAEELDLDAGLDAIITPSTGGEPADLGAKQRPRRDRAEKSVTDLLRAIATAPPIVRLSIRTQVGELARVLSYGLHLTGALAGARILNDHLNRDRDRPRDRQISLDVARDRELPRDIAEILARDLLRHLAEEPVPDLPTTLLRDLADIRGQAQDLAETLVRARDHSRRYPVDDLIRDFDNNAAAWSARHITRTLAQLCREFSNHLLNLARRLTHQVNHELPSEIEFFDLTKIESVAVDWLVTAVTDFTGADLQDMNLAGVSLDEVRWSDATIWPEHWVERIRRASVPLGGGVYEVRPETTVSDESPTLAPH